MAPGWISTALILVPAGAALLLWLAPLDRFLATAAALAAATVELALWSYALATFRFDAPGLQMEQRLTWSDDLNISYHTGFYGFSLWLSGLMIVVGLAAVAYGAWAGRERPRAYFGLMLFLTGAVVGCFAAQDLVLFYVCFEAMLIPLYVLVGVWGGERRFLATIKFVVYTMAGSLFMLAAIVVFGLAQGSFDLVDSGTSGSTWVFLGFALGFAVKAPLVPFHGWLPDAYRQAPPEVSAILSGVLSKVAAYGFLRIAIAKFPDPASGGARTALLVLGVVGLLYGSLIAFRAPDFRGVVAYSSLAQMGLITLGLFAINDLGLDGAVLQMVAHGLVSATLFLIAGCLEHRTGTDRLVGLGGMARGRPVLATVLLATGVIALAVPGSATFAGEFSILAGIWRHGWLYAVLGALAIVLAAMYTLRLVSAVLHQQRGPSVPEGALDLRLGELGVLLPLVAALVALSAWPAAISQRSFPGDQPTNSVKTQFAPQFFQEPQPGAGQSGG